MLVGLVACVLMMVAAEFEVEMVRCHLSAWCKRLLIVALRTDHFVPGKKLEGAILGFVGEMTLQNSLFCSHAVLRCVGRRLRE